MYNCIPAMQIDFLTFIFNFFFLLSPFTSLSPLRRQIILESSGSLSPPSMALPKSLCDNLDYLPPALPPKRQRANSKTMNSLHTPPSSPKMCLNESIDESAETSSQTQNNNHVHGKCSLVSDTLGTSSRSLTPVTPTTPSFAATPTITQSKSANVPLISHTSATENSSIESPTMMKAPTESFEPNNHVADADVRTPIYSNDNSNTNSRYSDENHYIYLYDGGGGDACNDKHKPNKNGIDSGTSGGKAKVDSDGGGSNINITSTKTINSNSKIKNNINNNNNSNTSDNNEQSDESVVVLRHPSASMHSQKVRMVCFTFFLLLISEHFCNSAILFRFEAIHVGSLK